HVRVRAVEQRARDAETPRAEETVHAELDRETVELRRLERIGVALEVGRAGCRDRALERERLAAEPALAEHAEEQAERLARRAREVVEQQHFGVCARARGELERQPLAARSSLAAQVHFAEEIRGARVAVEGELRRARARGASERAAERALAGPRR